MNKQIEKHILEQATTYYRLARVGISSGRPVTLLHIEAEYTFAAIGSDANKPAMIWQFPIGSGKTSRRYFKHNPPTPAEIEEAIMVVEDEVMPLKKLLLPNSMLITLNKEIQRIAQQTETTLEDGMHILRIGNMESVFNRLAAIITGRPASMDTLPTDPAFAASLLIVREFMHHLGFTSIQQKPSTSAE